MDAMNFSRTIVTLFTGQGRFDASQKWEIFYDFVSYNQMLSLEKNSPSILMQLAEVDLIAPYFLSTPIVYFISVY